MNSLTFKVFENNPDIVMSLESDGSVAKKIVSVDDLTASLANSYHFSTGIMPRGARFFSGTPVNYRLGIEISAMSKKCNILGEDILLPFPSCLFTFAVKNNKLTETFIHALKKPIFSDAEELYKFPYGNVYYDGRICWGSVKIPEIKSPLALAIFVSMFLDSKFNDDLFESNTANFKIIGCEKASLRGVAKFMKGKNKFPLEVLNRSGDNLKVSDIMKGR